MKLQTTIKSDKRLTLDVKDKKILQILSNDARLPHTQIAKSVGLSRDSIAYRINKFEKEGLIQGYKTLINIKKFGLNNYHLFLQLNKPKKDIENSIIKNLAKIKDVRTIITYNGSYDLELAIVANSSENFEDILNNILFICKDNLCSYQILLVTNSLRSGALPNSLMNKKSFIKEKKIIDYVPGKKDFLILKELADDARKPLHSFSSKINLSADSISYRIKKLEQGNHILGYTPAINYDLLGFNVYAVLANISLLVEDYDKKLKDFFNSDPNVLWAVKTIGSYNVLLYLIADDPRSVHDTIHNLRSIFPGMIQKYELLLAEEEHKYTYYPESLEYQEKS